MLNPLVKITAVRQSTQFIQGGGIQKVTVYTYFVGEHGPFTLEYPLGQDTNEKVSSDIGAQVQKLVALGAVKLPQS